MNFLLELFFDVCLLYIFKNAKYNPKSEKKVCDEVIQEHN